VIAMLPTLQGPDITVGPMERINLQTDNTQPMETDAYSRSTVEFPCNGETCEAWLYMPKGIGSARPPVVIMGHGMGGQKVRGTGLEGVCWGPVGGGGGVSEVGSVSKAGSESSIISKQHMKFTVWVGRR
jgi:hypothetical protein